MRRVTLAATLTEAVAGVARMNYKQFFVFDAIGDIAWAIIVTLIGYWFGTKIPNIDHYILLAVGSVMVITLGPTFYHLAMALSKKYRQPPSTPKK